MGADLIAAILAILTYLQFPETVNRGNLDGDQPDIAQAVVVTFKPVTVSIWVPSFSVRILVLVLR